MKKKHLLFTMLALSLGCLTGGSSMMAQSYGWDAVYHQTQTTSADWTKLSEGSTSGKTLGSGTQSTTYYYMDRALNFTNTNGSGLTILGTVYLYIPAGVELYCEGSDASGATGAGAGIELSAGNKLYIIGGGVGTKVTANGGKAANGSNGGNGGNADFVYDSWMTSGTGGKGGDGGGGAGAGIGTRGGNGGIGGNGGEGHNHTTDWKTHDGRNGNNGTNGNTAENMGELYVDQTFGITVSATAGAGATVEGNGGKWGQSALDDDAGNNYSIAGGGGGGGGGFGGAASDIGTGGPGGGGGGGGAGGSIEWADTDFYTVRAYAGSGGNNADGSPAGDGQMAFVSWASLCTEGMVKTNGSWDEDDEKSSHGDQTDGTGGSGAGCGGASSEGSMNAGKLEYKITFSSIKTDLSTDNRLTKNAQDNYEMTYSPGALANVILPQNKDGYQWVLQVYGKSCAPNGTNASEYATTTGEYYGGNVAESDRTIALANVYGDLYFQEIATRCNIKDRADNTQNLVEYKNYAWPVTVRLQDRTLYRDGHWNTICLPFAMTSAQIANSIFEEAQIYQLDETNSGYYPNGGNIASLNLSYTTPVLFFIWKKVTELEAGKPYIVRWMTTDRYTTDGNYMDDTTEAASESTTPRHEVDFDGVTISATTAGQWVGTGGIGGGITFQGTFTTSTTLTGGDKTRLVLGSDDKLYYPKKNMSTGSCRGYFIIPQAAAASAPEIIMSFDGNDMATSIQTLNVNKVQQDATVYNLNGQRLSTPQKGLNIVNGKKYVLK